MKESLKDLLKSHFNSKSLSSDRLTELERLQKDTPRLTDRAQPRLMKLWSGVIFAASVLVVLISGRAILNLSSPSVLNQIASEISYNHKKDMQTEVQTSSIEEIGSYLSKLDFKLITPDRLPGLENWKIVGGRYCSIQGKLAAQLKVKTDDNRRLTLYQVAVPENFEAEGTKEVFVDGEKILLWTEKGLLLGLAGS